MKTKVGFKRNSILLEGISFAFSSLNNIYFLHNCDFVFVCVPTPMFMVGSEYLSYVDRLKKGFDQTAIIR